MLATLRKQTGSIVIKALLILLIISFGAWGIQDWLSPAISGNFVASVGGQEITPNSLQRRVNMQMNRLRSVLGNQLTLEQARQFGLIDAALSELVSRALMSEGASDMGVAISDELISSEIRSSEGFKGLTGNFDRDRFNRVLQSNGMNEGTYIAELRRDLGIEHFADSLTSGITAPKALVNAVYAYRNEKRTAEVMLVEDAAVQGVGEPDQSTLVAYHKEHAGQFTAPEYRKLTIVRLEADDLAKEIAISEADIKESYDSRLDEFSTDEKRHIFQILLDSEDKAKEAVKLLAEGRGFATVAKEIGGHDEGTTDLGTVTQGDMLPDLAAAVFGLAKDVVSDPVKSAFGWHIFKVTEIETGGVLTLDLVRDQVKTALAKEKAIDSLFDLSTRLEDELGGGATVEEAGRNLGLQILNIAAMDRSGNDKIGQPVKGLPTGATFMQIAFGVQEGEESQLTESGPEGFFIVRVDGVTAPALRPLDSVRDGVANAWKAAQRAEKTKVIAEKAQERLNSGADIKTVADELDLAFKTTKPFTRTDTGQISEVEGALVIKVFELQPGKAAIERSAEGYQVARMKDVVPVTFGGDEQGIKTLSDELATSLKGEVTAQLGASLRNEHGVNINQALVNQLFSTQ
jgi:peptidyl-prolyl cis-trans isomerase D